MHRFCDSRGRFVKNLVEPPNSPSSSSETSYKTESSNNHSETHNMENIDDPPPHNDPPYDNCRHDNPFFGNRYVQDYL